MTPSFSSWSFARLGPAWSVWWFDFYQFSVIPKDSLRFLKVRFIVGPEYFVDLSLDLEQLLSEWACKCFSIIFNCSTMKYCAFFVYVKMNILCQWNIQNAYSTPRNRARQNIYISIYVILVLTLLDDYQILLNLIINFFFIALLLNRNTNVQQCDCNNKVLLGLYSYQEKSK